MAVNHIIEAGYTAKGFFRTRPAFQYDYGQILKLEGFTLPKAFEVHFGTGNDGSVTMIGHDNQVDVPDECLRNAATVTAWLFLHDTANDGETRFVIEIPVKKRAEITNQEPTPVQQDTITQAIAALNAGIEAADESREAAETAQQAAEQAADSVKNAGATAATLSPGSTASVDVEDIDGVKTFQFGIPKGDKGDRGEPGYAVVDVSSTQPTEEINKLWIVDESPEEVTVPSYGEFQEAMSAINATKTNLIGESDKQSRQRSITGLVANPTNGFYKVSNGQFAESDSYRTYEYALPNGTNKYNLSIYQRGNGANDGIYYVYMAYDESNNLIDYRTQTVATQQLSIVVPDNAVKIIYTKENVASNSCMMTWKTSAFDHINALERNIAVFIGDSYVGGNSLGTDVDKRFSTVLSNRMGWVEKNFAVGGMGYVYGNTTFEDQIDNAVADNTYNHDDVKYVLICGGRNDGGTYPYMDATLTAAVQSAITAAKTGFPNATVIVVPMLWDYQYISRAIYPLYQTIIYAAQTLDAVVIPNAYTWLTGMKGMILSDGVHPNVTGHAIIASHIENALTTGNSFAFPSSRVLSPVSESIDGSATNYFTITQENGLIHFDAEFKLSAGVSANSTLFSLTVANNENVPAYTGNYERFLVVQKSDGALVTLSVTTTIADGGYTIIAKAVTALSAGTYYIDGEFIPFALQRFASWRS